MSDLHEAYLAMKDVLPIDILWEMNKNEFKEGDNEHIEWPKEETEPAK